MLDVEGKSMRPWWLAQNEQGIEWEKMRLQRRHQSQGFLGHFKDFAFY